MCVIFSFGLFLLSSRQCAHSPLFELSSPHRKQTPERRVAGDGVSPSTGGRFGVVVVGGGFGTAVRAVLVVIRNAVATIAGDALGGRVGNSVGVAVGGDGGGAVATAVGDALGGRVMTTEGCRIDWLLLLSSAVATAVRDALGGLATATVGKNC